MITDFMEIKDEKERAIYAQCREILDAWFIQSIKGHEKKDHKLYECWELEQKRWNEGLKEAVEVMKETNNQSPEDTLKYGDVSCTRELIDCFQRLLAIETLKAELAVKS